MACTNHSTAQADARKNSSPPGPTSTGLPPSMSRIKMHLGDIQDQAHRIESVCEIFKVLGEDGEHVPVNVMRTVAHYALAEVEAILGSIGDLRSALGERV